MIGSAPWGALIKVLPYLRRIGAVYRVLSVLSVCDGQNTCHVEERQGDGLTSPGHYEADRVFRDQVTADGHHPTPVNTNPLPPHLTQNPNLAG